MDKKRVYTFGNGQAEGKAGMRNLLGGKGANLAEMNLIGVPVPPGFTITTEVCTEYYEMGQEKVVALLKQEVENAIAHVETLMRSKFGDVENPLLVSVRSGARASMPGMMDTILNLGLNDEVVEGLIRKTGNPRFAWDSYRRFVQMYGDVVLGMKPVNKEDVDPFEAIIEEVKHAKGVKLDNELEVEDLKELVKKFKAAVKEQTGKDFPTCAYEQLWGAVCAVFNSWMNERAILYRKMEGIPDEWGTAVSVQAMVFGNMGESSATGVCFSRDAATGEDLFNGEYLINAQGEDVVAGIRTPQQITKIGSQRWAELAGVSEEERVSKYPSMEEAMPEIYKELDALQTKLENHYRDMQDMEFTVQEGKLWFLQTRNGKRTGAAMVKIAMDLLHQGMIDEKTALMRCEPNKLDELLHPVFDKTALKQAKVLTRGLPASPGAATGQIVFFADDAAEWHAAGKRVVMVRIETSPEDLAGMAVAEGILTARGGMTSHAAVVARGMGKCCVSGAGALNIDYKARTVEVDGVLLKEGDYISLNGSTGEVYKDKVETKAAELSGDFAELMDLADKYTKLQVRTNADTPHDAEVARNFGAVGIGLCRTEHMFFEGDRIKAIREMILADDEAGRRVALAKLLPIQRGDFEGLFKAMNGYPVTVRLLDPPLHEFVPTEEADIEALAKTQGKSVEDIKAIITAAQTSRRFSYREVGLQYLELMQEKGFTKNEELALFLGISHVSVFKRIQAARIDGSLIALFPDYEGIPNSFYSRLSKLQKYVESNLFILADVVDRVKEEIANLDISDIPEAQKIVMAQITKAVELLDQKPPAKSWETRDLANFANKDKYARISKNASGRKVRFEFNRMSTELMAEIEAFITDKLSSEK